MMARSALQSAGSCVMGRGFSPIPISMVNAGRRKHCRNQSLKPAFADSGGTGSGDKHVTGSDDGKGSGRFKISFHEIHSIFSGCNFKNNRFFRINLEFSAKKS